MNEEKKWVVYKHTAPNGKVYIGITCQKSEYRWNNGINYSCQPLFFHAIIKYGWINFKHKILYDGLTYEEAAEKETEIIKEYNSTDYKFGYNISGGASVFPDETFERKPMSEEAKKARSIRMSTLMKVKWENEEFRNKALEGLRKNAKREEYRKSVSEGLKRALKDPKLRKQRSDSMKERMGNEEYKKECIENLRKGNREKQWHPVRNLITGQQYDSIEEAARETGEKPLKISRHVRGIIKHKLEWEYVKGEDKEKYFYKNRSNNEENN